METRELPDGTVTLLFTDIEGSTRMLQELGREAYVRALTEHRRLLRDALTAHGGVEVEMQGDSFFFAFSFARDAVAAAAAGQRALAQHRWDSEPIHVRIGLHTGEPMQADGLYAGLDVHRAARVMSAGHGGQVLLSERTADLVEGELPDGVSLRDLGRHRLKDLSRPQRLYDLEIEGLPTSFPPPKTLERRSTNLPVVRTPLVGRVTESIELGELVRRPGVRLVTVTGPGGTGKTRLALHVAAEVIEDFEDGVFYIPLAPVRDPALVLPTLAQTLGVREHGGEPLSVTLTEFLRSRELLLLLDNLEHLLDAATDIASLLSVSERSKVLVTSRARLNLSGEHEYPVAALAESDAIRLLVERARAVKPEFRSTGENAAALLEICRRLDGLPLAIELAAARLKLLSPEALSRRLDQRLALLTGGARDADERQQTLRAAIEWSYDLLADEERRLFTSLSVFAGGGRLDAVEAVCGEPGQEASVLDGVASLIGKSLLREREDEDGEPRLWMLETLREFALERLAEHAVEEDTRRRHALHFLALAEEAEPELTRRDQLLWYDRLDREHDNVRAALEFALECEPEVALRLVGSLWLFWEVRDHAAEGLRWASRALAHPVASQRSRARALASAGWLAWSVGDARASERLIGEAIDLYEDSGDTARATFALVDRGWARFELGDRDGARDDARVGLARAREANERWTEAFGLQLLSALADDGAEAEAALVEAEVIFREVGDENFAHVCRQNRGWLALADGRYEEAIQTSRESAGARNPGPYLHASTLNNAAQAELLRGRPGEAASYLGESLAVLKRSPARRLASEALRASAAIAAGDGAADRSGRLLGAARALLESGGFAASVVEERIEAELIAPVREAFPEDFARGLEQGSAMQPSEAIDYALASMAVNVGAHP